MIKVLFLAFALTHQYIVCDVVLVIDNFIVRTHPNLDSVRDKYTSYFADVDLFYQKHFKTKMNLIHMHLEDGPTFSGTNDEGELLDSFRSALVGGFFGTDIPIGACTYHLMTGRDPVGIGGLSWVCNMTACEQCDSSLCRSIHCVVLAFITVDFLLICNPKILLLKFYGG